MNSTLAATGEPYQLSWLENQWEQLYEGRNPLLVTGTVAFVMHELVYFGRFLPFLLCDFIPYFKQYKIQQNKVNTSADYWKCTKEVLYQHFLYEAPLIFLFHPAATYLGMNISAPFPQWYVFVCFVMETSECACASVRKLGLICFLWLQEIHLASNCHLLCL